jgi:hypothetical protein
MIIAALSPSQRRFSSPSAARQSSKAMSSKGRHSFSKRSAHTRRSHPRPGKRSSSSFPPTTIRPAGLGTPISDPSATFKSP